MMPLRPPLRSVSAACALVVAVAACGGGGGPSDDPGGGGSTLVFQKPAGSGDGQTGAVQDTLPLPLIVLVTEGGAPAAGRVVTFTPLTAAGTLVSATDTTGADGLATATWILGTAAGTRQVRAAIPGTGLTPLIFTATVQPGPAADLTSQSGAGQVQEVGESFASVLTVHVADAFGNDVAGVTVQWEVVSGSVSLDSPTSISAGDGLASVEVEAGGAPGAATIRATATSIPSDTATFGLMVVPPPSIITVSSNFFTPAIDTIPAGTAVRWTWNSGTHDVLQLSGPAPFAASPTLSAPDQYGPILFSTPGRYTYECSLHAGMTAAIVVQ
jgi:hypothetical protein